MSAERPQSLTGLDITEVDDGVVVFDPTTSRVHHLNATAAVLLALCDGTRTADDLVHELSTLWQVDAASVCDIDATLLQLFDEQLIH